MDGSQPAPPADEDGPGILGNLPRTRPSVRSPRRAEAARPEADAAAATPEPESGGPEAAAVGAGPSREQELQQLAQAGLSLAGGAATLGLRAAGRAAAALRGAVERK